MRGQRHAHYHLKQAQPAASGGHRLPKRRGTFRGRVGEAACYFLEEPDRAKAYITLTAQALKSSPISFVMNVNLRVTRVDIKDVVYSRMMNVSRQGFRPTCVHLLDLLLKT